MQNQQGSKRKIVYWAGFQKHPCKENCCNPSFCLKSKLQSPSTLPDMVLCPLPLLPPFLFRPLPPSLCYSVKFISESLEFSKKAFVLCSVLELRLVFLRQPTGLLSHTSTSFLMPDSQKILSKLSLKQDKPQLLYSMQPSSCRVFYRIHSPLHTCIYAYIYIPNHIHILMYRYCFIYSAF